ncbi:hypothetical protein [Actomonas aquatica]|uniref:PEP-CTERM protein-sorting domain-containing protein n=1 Tax=Actomonas aquatica TaxID=2866162 RepID=A0ABZ1CD30_9BACT|nr:hypothetical protein [Opitutus sp. WL0086]WRQ89388.1 hypothetical protein K1X11_008200 [Opitutus sp. WL0086]
MNTLKPPQFLILAIALLPARILFAQATVFSASSPDGSWIDASIYSQPSLEPFDFGAQITVDPSSLTISFDEVVFSLPAFSATNAFSFTNGFGQTDDYTITAEVDVSSFRVTMPERSFDLVAGTGGIYVAQNSYAYSPSTSSAVVEGSFSGSYSVVGPNGTTSGSFDSQMDDLIYYAFPARLDTSDWPNQLTFESAYNFMFGVSQDLVTVEVDGRSISAGVQSWTFNAQMSIGPAFIPGQLENLTAVPEPSAFATIFALVALGWVLFLRRREGR